MNFLEKAFDPAEMTRLSYNIRKPLWIIKHPHKIRYGVLPADQISQEELAECHGVSPLYTLPPLYPEYMGNNTFNKAHKVRFAYMVGEMAHGIATAEMVIAANKAGLLGSFGAAGLLPNEILKNIHTIKASLGETNDNWASNLIYNPHESELERRIVALYLQEKVRRISASAYMNLSPEIVYYAFKGIKRTAKGDIVRENHVLAKLSRAEVAEHFMSPPPLALLKALVAKGALTEEEAELASALPIAEDITVEADSGGHTDNRPLCVLFPVIKQLSLQLKEKFNYPTKIRIGASGGLGTPDAVAAAFMMGADYVLTGSINQAALEAGVSDIAKKMLAQADMTDVEMAPAGDMFELGVKVQVLKKGTLFGRRAFKLYQYFLKYDCLEAIPDTEKEELEQLFFRQSLDETWKFTKQFFSERDPRQIDRAEKDPKYRMALVFRAYLGKTSRWAISGDETRVLDYQLWCGPSMGAFNRWVKDSFLEEIKNRSVQQIAYNLLEGAAIISRAYQLRSLGIAMPTEAFMFHPIPLG